MITSPLLSNTSQSSDNAS